MLQVRKQIADNWIILVTRTTNTSQTQIHILRLLTSSSCDDHQAGGNFPDRCGACVQRRGHDLFGRGFREAEMGKRIVRQAGDGHVLKVTVLGTSETIIQGMFFRFSYAGQTHRKGLTSVFPAL